MTETKQWTFWDQFWHVLQLMVALCFVFLAIYLMFNIEPFSLWLIELVNNPVNISAPSQKTLFIIANLSTGLCTIILLLIAILIINMRFDRRFRMRTSRQLRRLFLFLILLVLLALLLFFIAILFLGEGDNTDFVVGIFSGLLTETCGIILTILLLDMIGGFWAASDEEGIRILQRANEQKSPQEQLIEQLKQRKQEYIQAKDNAQQVAHSFWRRWNRDYLPPAYYEGAITAIDRILGDLSTGVDN